MDEDDARARGAATAARRPHLEDVATHVGLSPATVSLVLSKAPGPSAQTRRRVLQAAAELGYRPDRTARLLARRRSHLLGVLLEVRNSFHAELVEDLQAASEQAGYELVLSTVTRTRDERRAVETLLDFRCEALILLGPDASPARLAALGRQLPVIAVGRRVAADGVDVVRTADGQGVAQAVGYLAGLDIGPSPMSTAERGSSRGIAGAATARRCAGMGWLTACTSSPETTPRSRASAPPPHCLASLSFPRRC